MHTSISSPAEFCPQHEWIRSTGGKDERIVDVYNARRGGLGKAESTNSTYDTFFDVVAMEG